MSSALLSDRRDNSTVAAAPKPQQQIQREFWERIAGIAPFLQVFDCVLDGLFFMKDASSRLIWVSEKIWQRFGLSNPWEIAGKTDYEFFPKYVADNFVRDDRHVLKTGKPIVGRVEIWFNIHRRLDWFVTTKYPLRGSDGRPIGILGLIQNSAQQDNDGDTDSTLRLVLNYIEAHRDRTITVEELAEAAQLSPRQLLRRFRHEFGMSVHELVLKTRIQAASEAILRENATIAGVAADFGFYDQSAFTRQFRKGTGLTPLAFLRKYGRRPPTGNRD